MCYPPVKVRVLFFAKARDLSGFQETTIDLPRELAYGNLLNYLCRKFNLEPIRNCVIIAHNENYCEDNGSKIKLKSGDELAVIPPISGESVAMNYLKLTQEKLDVSTLSELVADEKCGAISLFVGTTRDSFEDKKVLNLEYEAYESMAEKSMSKICEDMRKKWPDLKHIAIYHRLGSVPVKEASVIIAISSPHRQDSLSGVQYAIDELKKSVPIWKKEQYENGTAEWKENKECPSEKNRFKRSKLNFETCTLENVNVPKNFIQISADEFELSRRMQCFIEKKREENDLNNILDFTNKTMQNENDEETCARVNSIVIKQKDSKGHLKVQRVNNEIGPQTKTDYTNTLDKLMDSGPFKRKIKTEKEVTKGNLPVGIAERIENAEKCLQLTGNNSKEVYERLKALENRLLYLETVSPEYYHFLNPKTPVDTKNTARKKTYTVVDLDYEIEKLKVKLEKVPKSEV